jgi:hypothetical protein
MSSFSKSWTLETRWCLTLKWDELLILDSIPKSKEIGQTGYLTTSAWRCDFKQILIMLFLVANMILQPSVNPHITTITCTCTQCPQKRKTKILKFSEVPNVFLLWMLTFKKAYNTDLFHRVSTIMFLKLWKLSIISSIEGSHH